MLAALLALLLQVALAGAHRPQAQDAAFALKLALGVEAPICQQPKPDGAPDPQPCPETCPLCQFAAHASLLATAPPTTPEARLTAPLTLHIVNRRESPPALHTPFAEARGPPFKS